MAEWHSAFHVCFSKFLTVSKYVELDGHGRVFILVGTLENRCWVGLATKWRDNLIGVVRITVLVKPYLEGQPIKSALFGEFLGGEERPPPK